MGDTYTEVLVEKKTTSRDMFLKAGLYFVTFVTVFGGLFVHSIFLIAAVVMGIVDYIVLPKLRVEYEYLYVNGELDVDIIYSRTKRKKVGSYNLKQMEIMAPATSHYLDSYRNNPQIKTVDYSSRNPESRAFAVILPKDNERICLLFEPDEEILKDVRTKMPRKVFND